MPAGPPMEDTALLCDPVNITFFHTLYRNNDLVRKADNTLPVPADLTVIHTDLVRAVRPLHPRRTVTDHEPVRIIDLHCPVFLQAVSAE